MNKHISFKNIFKLLLDNKKHLLLGQAITFIAILISIPIPLMLPILVDEVLLKKPDFFINIINDTFGIGNAFYYIAIVTLVVILLRLIHFVFTIVITKLFTYISKYVTYKLRVKVLSHLKFVNMNEYESLGSGAISSNLVTDINTLDTFIISIASKFVASVLTLIGVAIVIIAIDPILGLMILFIQPIIMLLSKKISKKTGALKKEENQAIEEFQDNVGETLDLFGQIKASNKEEYFFNEAIKKAKNIQIASNEYNYKSVAYERLSFTVFLIAFEIFRATGLILVEYNDLSIGMMFAMFGYIWFIMTPVQDILSIQYSYASANAAISRINRILDLDIEKSGDEELCVKNKEVNISIKNLNFSYTEEKNILDDISLDINTADKVALIGASGSGKTTLAQIISGFYSKKNGDIFYNGVSIEKLDKKSLRENIFLVLQMPILFNNTLKFNITMGNENISDEQIHKALKIAQLDDVIAKMTDGLETKVGRHGVRLSGGQRQRLSIARMIIADPAVVIFDESTSALDVHTEAKLFIALEEILKNKTVITIAHRLSTVKNANIIYVLDEGKIVQRGNHKELEEEEGHYLEFVKNQLI
ncbi:ABC transporter ATP-binding protein/permease [Poseidonibacter lekithochrous]|uniref:ABC transporter ATP-binding protein n=1 Tax=Poseidonibacter TaxID=2321187 RepID=UPI001C08D5CE|nr:MULTISPECIES: ABC transporter ATP-binding protein [Poseidonibacter]MBU3013580.1 ABC transporter ATP-binding protein/permease [Poseidonibacter lekithochrous]MDO6826877.1 ABC transporter ATP-binding protein [Poseidonibacter sp. 1_MG-2023]